MFGRRTGLRDGPFRRGSGVSAGREISEARGSDYWYFSPKRLARMREVLERYVDAGYVLGAVATVARHGEVHIEATGNLAFEGEGSGTPMAADTICRIASTTKPVIAACAMTLVEDCTLRLRVGPLAAEIAPLARPDVPIA